MTSKPSSTGKTASADYVRGYETMTRKQIVDIAADRAIIERVKGFLMFVYDTDADTAFELLRRRSRSTHVRVRELAEQVMTDFLSFTPRNVWTCAQPAATRYSRRTSGSVLLHPVSMSALGTSVPTGDRNDRPAEHDREARHAENGKAIDHRGRHCHTRHQHQQSDDEQRHTRAATPRPR
ncbi:hypothetical protein TUM20984_45490 [Mycobacterium antarcticum]|nr:hypothetical protein TUM20984_45490 [Mycolicibacterium sp. TUM20984]